MEISRHWRIRKARYSMVGGICPNCESKMFPVREVCPSCGHGSNELVGLTSQESLYAQPIVIRQHVMSV